MTDADLLRTQPVQTRSTVRLKSLLAAGVQLYNDPAVGRDKLTTAMVVDLAKCSIGTFYRYFDDRVALLDAIAPDRDQSPTTLTFDFQKGDDDARPNGAEVSASTGS